MRVARSDLANKHEMLNKEYATNTRRQCASVKFPDQASARNCCLTEARHGTTVIVNWESYEQSKDCS